MKRALAPPQGTGPGLLELPVEMLDTVLGLLLYSDFTTGSRLRIVCHAFDASLCRRYSHLTTLTCDRAVALGDGRHFARLETLCITQEAALDERDLDMLASLATLRTLSLCRPPICPSRNGLWQLEQLTELKLVRGASYGIRLPKNLTALDISCSPLSDLAGLTVWPAMRTLRVRVIVDGPRGNADALHRLNALLVHQTSLTELDVTGISSSVPLFLPETLQKLCLRRCTIATLWPVHSGVRTLVLEDTWIRRRSVAGLSFDTLELRGGNPFM